VTPQWERIVRLNPGAPARELAQVARVDPEAGGEHGQQAEESENNECFHDQDHALIGTINQTDVYDVSQYVSYYLARSRAAPLHCPPGCRPRLLLRPRGHPARLHPIR